MIRGVLLDLGGCAGGSRGTRAGSLGLTEEGGDTVTPEREQALPDFEDSDVQIVYGILCDPTLTPPTDDHWEGVSARHIVAQLRAASEAEKDRMWQALGQYPLKPRRPMFDDSPDGYSELDIDYVENNLELCVVLLDALAGTTPQSCTACAEKQGEIDRLREMLETRPHAISCSSGWWNYKTCGHVEGFGVCGSGKCDYQRNPCDCWKTALSGSPEVPQ